MAAFNLWIEIAFFIAMVIAGIAFQAKTMTGERHAQ